MRLHTYADALADLEALVDERGDDFVYQPNRRLSCTYVRDGQGDCGLGKVFADRWGVSLDDLAAVDQGAVTIRNALFDAGHTLAPDADRLLFRFQSLQDDRMTYGAALEIARSDEPAQTTED